jgi:hypothetical protein
MYDMQGEVMGAHHNLSTILRLTDALIFSDVAREDCTVQAVARVTPVKENKLLGERSAKWESDRAAGMYRGGRRGPS